MAYSGGIRHLQWRFLALHATISVLSLSSSLSALPLTSLHPHTQEERRRRTIGRNHRLGLAVAASGVLPWVPPQALIEDGDESFVYVVEDGKDDSAPLKRVRVFPTACSWSPASRLAKP